MVTANQSCKVKDPWYIMTNCSYNDATQMQSISFNTCIYYLQALYYDPHADTYMMDVALSLYPSGPQ